MKKQFLSMLTCFSLLFIFTNNSYAFNPKDILGAYKEAFPSHYISVANSSKYGWTMTVNGNTFYWANGRLLPYEKRNNYNNYKSYIFYTYNLGMPKPEDIPQSRIDSLNRYAKNPSKLSSKKYKEGGLNKILYGGNSKKEIDKLVKKTNFLGRSIVINPLIEAPLRNVEKEIYKIRNTDKEVKRFLNNIGYIGCYKWREVKDTGMISYHSYGVALDITPEKNDKPVYWSWTKGFREDWLTVPISERWTPPLAIIKIFEDNGFIWGGKWTLYDNIHFEYRPELLVYAKSKQ